LSTAEAPVLLDSLITALCLLVCFTLVRKAQRDLLVSKGHKAIPVYKENKESKDQ
jgi:hypothetical protein